MEIYITWCAISLVDLSSDVALSIIFDFYELWKDGVHFSVHVIELTLGAVFGIIYLNFMPHERKKYILYFLRWWIYSILFEGLLVHLPFINYTSWKLWYSAIFYIFALLFTRWHLYFIRSGK